MVGSAEYTLKAPNRAWTWKRRRPLRKNRPLTFACHPRAAEPLL